ncbi:MAG: Eco57I restriction-modification methylase domain-containing protein, partial [Acidilobaceae archaeon]
MGKARVRSDVGKVATLPSVALHMVAKLFNHTTPPPEPRVLDAGCGSGVFVEAIIAYLRRRGAEIPEIVCIDNDFNLVNMARRRFEDLDRVKVVYGDFLAVSERELGGGFDYIISNPPYVSYEAIDPKSRDLYRRVFKVARGRFDIYMLFFEKALTLLKPKGRMVFITPEKYLYVLSASSLRRLLARHAVEEIELVDERVFGALAYPAITVVRKEPPTEPTTFRLRDGSIVKVTLPSDGRSWLQVVEEARLSIRQPARCYKLERL